MGTSKPIQDKTLSIAGNVISLSGSNSNVDLQHWFIFDTETDAHGFKYYW